MWQGFPKNRLFRKKYDENRYFVAKLPPFGAIFGRFCSPKRQSITLERVESHPQRGRIFQAEKARGIPPDLAVFDTWSRSQSCSEKQGILRKKRVSDKSLDTLNFARIDSPIN